MKRFFLILKVFSKSKFIFKNPSKSELVIFDGESLFDLKNIIKNYNFFVLENRVKNIKEIYFSFAVLKFFLKHYKGNIMTAYLVSLLEIIRPKVVLTNIDNSFKFFDLAKELDKKMTFVAVQNASRYDLNEHKHKYKKNIIKSDLTKKFYIPNFLCFGQYEIDDYKHHEIKVKNFFKVGSLRLANFFHHIKTNKIKIEKQIYDICLISEPAVHRNVIWREKNFEKNAANVAKFTIKFCMKHNMKLIFAMKRNKMTSPQGHKLELNFYKNYLNKEEYNYLINNSVEKKNIYTSYITMLQSRVTVGYWSTMLRENLAIGGKILCCNLLPTNIWNFPVQGMCYIRNCSFEEFERRLLDIHSLPEKNYFSKLTKDKCYAVEYNKTISTIDIIKKK